MTAPHHAVKTIFFGSADFAVPSLENLIAAGHEILAVVTQPDKPHGRGLRLSPSPIKELALRLNLPVLQPKRVRDKDFILEIQALSPDLLVVAAFGQIVPQALLDLPRIAPINVHGSLLPQYRGAAPIQRAIIGGERKTGVTTMWMDATLDTGDMLLAASTPIDPDDTSATLTARLAEIGARLVIDTIAGLIDGSLARRPQDDALATLAPAIRPEEGDIPWSDTATAVRNRIRGLSPKPGAYSVIRGKRVKIWSAALAADESATPGTVLEIARKPAGVCVSCGADTTILITEVQPESGRRMPAADWARGVHITPGDTLDRTP